MIQKSPISVKTATEKAFKSLPDQFRGYELANVVKITIRRRKIYPDSVFRKLRVLRKDKVLNYEVVGERADSLYRKLPC